MTKCPVQWIKSLILWKKNYKARAKEASYGTMTALTKSEMAERLFEELGSQQTGSQRIGELFFEEIRIASSITSRSSCLALAILICATKSAARPQPKTGRRFPSRSPRGDFPPGKKLKAPE